MQSTEVYGAKCRSLRCKVQQRVRKTTKKSSTEKGFPSYAALEEIMKSSMFFLRIFRRFVPENTTDYLNERPDSGLPLTGIPGRVP